MRQRQRACRGAQSACATKCQHTAVVSSLVVVGSLEWGPKIALFTVGVVGVGSKRRGYAPALATWPVGGDFSDDEAPAVHVVRDLEAHASHVWTGHCHREYLAQLES